MNSEEYEKENEQDIEVYIYVRVAICRRLHEIGNKRIYTSG